MPANLSRTKEGGGGGGRNIERAARGNFMAHLNPLPNIYCAFASACVRGTNCQGYTVKTAHSMKFSLCVGFAQGRFNFPQFIIPRITILLLLWIL